MTVFENNFEHIIFVVMSNILIMQVSNSPQRHSLLYVPNEFMIPGGRFREYYYWDSYWIIKGLLASS